MRGKDAQIALYYLFMMVDGKLSYSEEKRFDFLCREMGVDINQKKSIVDECIKLLNKFNNSSFTVVITEKLYENISDYFGNRPDTCTLASILWNLITLGYSDKNFSKEEEFIIKFLIKVWSLDEDLYIEMIDTMNAIAALEDQKDWLVSVFSEDADRDAEEKNIDNAIEVLESDIKLTIQELGYKEV